MTDFASMARVARDEAETRLFDVREQRKVDRRERKIQFDVERESLCDSTLPVLIGAMDSLRRHGIPASIQKGWLETSHPSEHPELIFFCDGPEMRNLPADRCSPKSARAIFHYELGGLVAEVTDYSFSTIRHPAPGADAEERIEGALKFIIESYYRELEHLRLEGS